MVKSILLDKIWFNHISLHSRCVNGEMWHMSLLSSACLTSGSVFALHANMNQFFIYPLISLLLHCTSVFYTTNLKLLITVSSRQNKFLTPSYHYLILTWLLLLLCLYQYFEGDDLPEATVREIDLLMDQPDQFRNGVCVVLPVCFDCQTLWLYTKCSNVGTTFFLFSIS